MSDIGTVNRGDHLETMFDETVYLELWNVRVEQPVFLHPMAGKELHFSATIVSCSGWRKDLDGQIRRFPGHFLWIQQMHARRAKHEKVWLDDVVVGEHDIERCE